jgi:hypothetical protein
MADMASFYERGRGECETALIQMLAARRRMPTRPRRFIHSGHGIVTPPARNPSNHAGSGRKRLIGLRIPARAVFGRKPKNALARATYGFCVQACAQRYPQTLWTTFSREIDPARGCQRPLRSLDASREFPREVAGIAAACIAV